MKYVYGKTRLHQIVRQENGSIAVDVLPYLIFGNNDDDPGPIINFAEKWAKQLVAMVG